MYVLWLGIGYLISQTFDVLFKLLFIPLGFLQLLLKVDYLFILLHDLMGKFFFFLVAISILFLLIQFLKEFYLCIEFFNGFIFLFYHVLQVIHLVPFEVLFLIFDLFDFFLEDAILLYLIFKLLFQDLKSPIHILCIFFWLLFCLDFFQDIIKLFIKLLELRLQGFVLFLLLLDQFQPQLMLIYISETRAWYFLMIFFTPSLESSSVSFTMISLLRAY